MKALPVACFCHSETTFIYKHRLWIMLSYLLLTTVSIGIQLVIAIVGSPTALASDHLQTFLPLPLLGHMLTLTQLLRPFGFSKNHYYVEMGSSCGVNGRWNVGKEIRCPEKEGEKNGECDGRIALWEMSRKWKENGGQ